MQVTQSLRGRCTLYVPKYRNISKLSIEDGFEDFAIGSGSVTILTVSANYAGQQLFTL